ncbi:MAG: PAS domain S-box protein [Eubacteriales bacterium]|nr:PAS domain S-box protein [Eubacteriales bacterium]
MERTKDELLLLITYFKAVIDNLPFEVWFKDSDGNYPIVNNKPDPAFAEGECYKDKIGNSVYEIHKTPIFDESGKLIGTAGYTKDITESKKTYDALLESERSKAVLLSNLPGVAYRSSNDHNFTMTFISEGCYDLTGYTAEELISKNPSYYDLIHPEHRDFLFKKWQKDIGLNLISTDEYPITTASGETKWVWEQFQEVYDSEQKLVATEGFITDITERKLAEKALKQSEERFRTIFDEAPLGMGIFDSISGEAYQVNARYAEIVGRTKEEVLSLNWKEYSHPDEIEENLNNHKLLNAGKIPGFSMNKRYIKPGGSIVWVNMTIAPFMYEESSNPCHLCMIEDITERKQAEEEIIYLSYYDQLTGLFNRRYYEEELRKIDTVRNLPLSLVMADVNGLKLINDAFGHMAGDQLLKRVANIIRGECRADDIVARIGGDEFILLLPKTDTIEAEKIIESINLKISREKINNIIYSVSFGLGTKRGIAEKITKIYMQAEEQMYRNKLSESTSMRNETIKVITKTLYEKNRREQQHCERVSKLCETIGKALKMSTSDVNDLKTAGLLHDIGKIGIDKKLLNKQGELTEMEWADIRRHPEIGYQILRSVDEFAPIAEYVLYHHERIDGRGYPRGLKGDEILLQSKIISIADSYDAMTSERSYKEKLDQSQAIEEIRRNAGTQFDKDMAKLFIEKVIPSEIR